MAAVGGAAQKKLLPATDVYLLPRTGAWHPRTEDTGLCAATWVCVLIVRGPCVFRIYIYSVLYLLSVSKSISEQCIVPAPRAGPHTT